MQHKKTTRKIQCRKKHIQRESELSSPELSMLDKGPKQKSVEIQHMNFHNHDLINSQIEKTGNFLVVLQPNPPLHYVVYQTSEANSSTPFHLLIQIRQYI